MTNFNRVTVRSVLALFALVPIFVMASVLCAEATTIPFTLSESFTYDQVDTIHRFEFGDNLPGSPSSTFSFTLRFDEVFSAFEATVTATSALTATLPSGYTCIPIAGTEDPNTSCVQFRVSGPINGPNQPGENNISGPYSVLIQWYRNTDADFPDDPPGRVQILHYADDDLEHGNDITVPGTYFAPGHPPEFDQCFGEGAFYLTMEEDFFPACGAYLETDPGVGGREDAFSVFVTTLAPGPSAADVPEPGTMILLGTGVAMLAVVRRRAGR